MKQKIKPQHSFLPTNNICACILSLTIILYTSCNNPSINKNKETESAQTVDGDSAKALLPAKTIIKVSNYEITYTAAAATIAKWINGRADSCKITFIPCPSISSAGLMSLDANSYLYCRLLKKNANNDSDPMYDDLSNVLIIHPSSATPKELTVPNSSLMIGNLSLSIKQLKNLINLNQNGAKALEFTPDILSEGVHNHLIFNVQYGSYNEKKSLIKNAEDTSANNLVPNTIPINPAPPAKP